ncbi:DUF202 domain-containing protein [Ilumatobacter nonamiensis]|uniref:DUF202 domain-containing protein n=1 Tax=Ilumatobacter nonamiensis TaxID=467093 RepID=UPI000344E337|nr:DUF202 domain-containing protein [Ilumatobacter nonamiensis]
MTSSGGSKEPRPTVVFDRMLQHERTALAWERTAIATIVAGALLARHAATIHIGLAGLGVAQLIVGGALLIWTGRHYEHLHAPLRAGENPAHPRAARLVGITTIGFTGVATVVAVAALVT